MPETKANTICQISTCHQLATTKTSIRFWGLTIKAIVKTCPQHHEFYKKWELRNHNVLVKCG